MRVQACDIEGSGAQTRSDGDLDDSGSCMAAITQGTYTLVSVSIIEAGYENLSQITVVLGMAIIIQYIQSNNWDG